MVERRRVLTDPPVIILRTCQTTGRWSIFAGATEAKLRAFGAGPISQGDAYASALAGISTVKTRVEAFRGRALHHGDEVALTTQQCDELREAIVKLI